MAKRRARGRASGTSWRLWLWRLLALSAVLGLVAVVLLDIQVRSKFEGRKWAVPAHVYARPFEAYEGMQLKPAVLEAQLKSLGYQPVASLSGPGQFERRHRGAETLFAINSRGFEFWDQAEPPARWDLIFSGDQLTRLVGGNLLRLEPEKIGGIYPAHQEDRQLVRLQDIPPLLGETLLAVEDKHFLEHQGVSIRAIGRALLANVKAGGVAQGGSTITQQLVKNFYLSNERSLSRKGMEAIMALLLEWHYSKAEILETYLNEVYLGQQGAKSINGFGLASQHYFRRPLNELGVDQIALLVGLVKGASYYNPWRSPARAKERRDLVLGIMREAGLINERQHRIESQRPLRVAAPNQEPITRYANFLDLVKRQLRRDYSADDLQSEGLRVFTTLETGVQDQVEKTLASSLKRVEADRGLSAGSLQGAVVVARVGSAEVLALAGDRTPSLAGFNRALDARRPIGSLAKPAVYLAAFEQSPEYQLNSRISDEPVRVAGPDGEWAPTNYDRESHGPVPLYQALAQSYNQATARLGMQLGLNNVARTMERLGGEVAVPRVPAMLLGAVDMSPLAVTEQYHTLAADGFYSPLRAILEVTDQRGRPLNRYPLAVEQRFDAQSVFLLHYALRSVMREGTGKQAYRQLPAELDVAGKTGTTNDQRDSWFAGFSAEHVATVWVGRDDNGTTPLTGATGALPIWSEIVAGLGTRGLDAPAPAGVTYHWTDERNGLASSENCRFARPIPYSQGLAPSGKADCEWVQNPLMHWWKKLWQD